MSDDSLEQYVASKEAAQGPANQIPVDQDQINQFDLAGYANNKESSLIESGEKQLQAKYGDIPHQGKAFVQGTLQGGTLGLSDFANKTPEERAEARGTKEANPWAYGAGQVVGTGLLGIATALTGGGAGAAEAAGASAAKATIGSLISEGAVKEAAKLAAKTVAKETAIGGTIGFGNAVSELALQEQGILENPRASAEKVVAHVGLGALIGGGAGILSSGVKAIPALMRRAGVEGSVPIEGAEAVEPIIDAPKEVYKGIKPTDINTLSKRVEEAKKYGNFTEMPEKIALSDAASRVDLENPIHPLQLDSLDSPAARDTYKLAQEFPGKEGEAIKGYEALQKQELVGKTKKDIIDLSPEGVAPTPDAAEGGNRAIKAFTEQYQNEKNALKPIFQKLKDTPLAQGIDHTPGVIEALTKGVPGTAQMFDTSGAEIAIKPYRTTWGIDESTYKAIKQVVESLKEEPTDFQGLSNIRKGLSQHVDVLSQGEGPQQIRALKSSMMDYIQKAVQEVSPDIEVRDAFKRYAINEQERGIIERIFGASVGSPEFGAISKVKPESILDRVFANTANVKAAKSILEPAKFKEMLSNWLSENSARVTDKGAFSSNKWNTFLRSNQDALKEAFSDNPGIFQHLKDMTTIMRILPDSASINPSGTAKTLWSKLSELTSPEGIGKHIFGELKERFQHAQNMAKVNAGLAGRADQISKLSFIKNTAEKTSGKIQAASKSITSGLPIKPSLIPPAVEIGDREYNERVNKIREMNGNPKKLMDKMSNHTSALSVAAPNFASAMHTTVGNAVSFLASKIPSPSESLFLSQKFEPSGSQKRMFNNYYNVVSQPLSVFHSISNGTLNAQSIEALNSVHPELYSEMKQSIMHNLKPETAKELPYSRKISIAKFLESPLDENMTPSVVLSNQQSLNSPSLSQNDLPNQGRKSAPMSGLAKLKVSSRVASRTQREDEV